MLSRATILSALLIIPVSLLSWGYGDVVINELMWMGSSLSPYDEYLELRNMTGDTVDFRSGDWSIYREGELMTTVDEGVLEPGGYFLICRRSPSESVVDVTPDLVTNTLVLTNSNTAYSLYAGPSDASVLIDVADDGAGFPMSGRFSSAAGVWWSMERDDPPGEGDDESRWHPACLSEGFAPGSPERGTPGVSNYENVPPEPVGSIDISPDFISNDTSITALATGIHDPDSIPGENIVIFDWFADGSLIYSSADSAAPHLSRLDSVLTESGDEVYVRCYHFDGTDSSGAALSGSVFVHFQPGEVIINEVGWPGALRDSDDVWMELWSAAAETIFFSRTPFLIRGWDPAAGDTTGLIQIDGGFLPPDNYFLISARDVASSAIDVTPDIVDSALTLRRDELYLELLDRIDGNGARVDAAGDGGLPPAGIDAPGDSARYSMSRETPPGSGTLPSSWFTSEVTVGFDSMALERGTPGSGNTRNSPPVLDWAGTPGFESDGLEPELGNMDSFFVWKIKYADADSEAPEYVQLLFDENGDGDFAGTREILEMRREDSDDDDYADGVIYKYWVYGLRPMPASNPYSFRCSDGNTITRFPIPSLPGPVVEPTIRVSFFGTAWEFYGASAGEIALPTAAEMPIMFHTGDVPFQIGASIAEADIYEHSADTFSYSSGGWYFADSPDSSGINLYKLSLLFLRADASPPDSADFNDAAEDLLTGGIKWFDGDTLGRPSDSMIADFLPGEIRRIGFRLDLPDSAYGFRSDARHRITVRIHLRLPLP